MAAICAVSSVPEEFTWKSEISEAMSSCCTNACAIWIICVRQTLPMKELLSAMLNGPSPTGSYWTVSASPSGE